MDSNQPYDGNVNKGRAYIRPGASSITLTFSNDTSAGWSGARIIIYDGNGYGIEYKGSELQGVTKTVHGDTVRVWISPDGRSFKVTNITVTYPTNGVGSTLSGGDIWIIAGVALACTAVIAVLFIRKKKNAN